MLRCAIRLLLALAALASSVWPARADITAFLGAAHMRKPPALAGDEDKEFKTTKGVAIGFSLVVVGFEFEWASTDGDDSGCAARTDFREICAPSLTTGMVNGLLQTPHGITPVQLYATAGAGFYREHFGVVDESDWGLGTNLGGGAKIDLIGPLRLRLDYRVFKLGNGSFHGTPQRFYAGANLAF